MYPQKVPYHAQWSDHLTPSKCRLVKVELLADELDSAPKQNYARV